MSLKILRQRYPWPAQKPDVPEKPANSEKPLSAGGSIFGWFHGENRAVLKKLLSASPPVVLELGALLGLSTKFLAEWAPDSTIITIDHWKGSAEHQKSKPLADVLHTMFETFCVHLWEHRSHVIPMRTTTIKGMVELFRLGITPKIVYIDAGHETGPVYADAIVAMTLWPEAHVVGDDGCWKSIQAALKDLQRQTNRVIDTSQRIVWQIPPLGQEPIGLR